MKKIVILLFSLLFVLAFIGCDNFMLPDVLDDPVEDPVEDPETSPYPSIVWLNAPAPPQAARAIVSEPVSSKYDELYKGLDFEATYLAQVVRFGFVMSMDDFGFLTVHAMPVDVDGDNDISDSEKGNGVFNSHTIEIDILYQSASNDSTYSTTFNIVDDITYFDSSVMTEFEVDYVDSNSDFMFGPADGDYTLAVFKEIRFIAPDLTVYHTWTNPDL